MNPAGREIIETLNRGGHEAYFVGGCVRDHLRGVQPHDYDICTSALPEETMRLFSKAIGTGIDYGTVTVMVGTEAFEVTTYRRESDYDGRRPKVVAFSKNVLEDLSRRDFTVNAMAMGLDGELIDPFGGKRDLEDACLRFVGHPEERLREDRLRILRYVRFLTQLNYRSAHILEEAQWQVNLSSLSQERIRDEFCKILLSERAAIGMRHLQSLGLLAQICPEITPCLGFEQRHPAHAEDVFDHTMTVLSQTRPDLNLRLAALCHDMGKPGTFTLDDQGVGHFYGHQTMSEALARQWMTRLKFSSAQIETVANLVREHMRVHQSPSKPAARRLLRSLSHVDYKTYFALQIADTSACQGDREQFIRQIEAMAETCDLVMAEETAFKVTDLAVNGNDLLALGLRGRDIGQGLNHLLELITDEQVANTKDALIQALQTWIEAYANQK